MRNPAPTLAVCSRAFVAFLSALPLVALPACAPTTTETRGALNYAEDAKKAYDKAVVSLNEHDWETARALFKEIKRKYSYSRYARLAELRLADVDAGAEKLSEAIQGYRSFVHDHRTDPEVPYARFRICKSLFEQVSEGGFFLPPLEERDQGVTSDSYRELSSFAKDFPTGQYAAQTKYMLAIVTGRLVRHEIYVARYYLKRNELEPVVSRVLHTLRTYNGSGLEPEAMVLLGETYLKMHKPVEARATFSEMLAKYPSAPFSDSAKNFLLEMDRAGK